MQTEALAHEIPARELIESPRVNALHVLAPVPIKLDPPESSAIPVPLSVAKQVETVGQLTASSVGLEMGDNEVAPQVAPPSVVARAFAPVTTMHVPTELPTSHEIEGFVTVPLGDTDCALHVLPPLVVA